MVVDQWFLIRKDYSKISKLWCILDPLAAGDFPITRTIDSCLEGKCLAHLLPKFLNRLKFSPLK
jgi:hypothetical protein